MSVDTSSYDFMMQQLIVHVLLFLFMSLHVWLIRTDKGLKNYKEGIAFYIMSGVWSIITLIRTGFGIALYDNGNPVAINGISLEKYMSNPTFKYSWAVIIGLFVLTEMCLIKDSKIKEDNDKNKKLDLDTEAGR